MLLHFINIMPHAGLDKPEKLADRTLVIQVTERLYLGWEAVQFSVGDPEMTGYLDRSAGVSEAR